MGSFLLMGCGGSKFTVEEDELGLPCKRDVKKGETTKTKRENGTIMNGDSTNKSHESDNGSKETTTMSTEKQQVPTYEVKLVNNHLVQHVTLSVVTGKNSTTTDQGKKDSDSEDGSRISNFNDDTYTRSPSFREYCNTGDSRFDGTEDKELGTENDELLDKKSQTKNEIVVTPVMDDIPDEKSQTKNEIVVSPVMGDIPDKKTATDDNENEETKKNESSTNKDGKGLKLRKVFPIHMIQAMKLTNMRRKSSR